ncbi:hypothetical protein CQW23_01732 [Capsicum baccatum]|uniref:RNase H type-1 domain-containing protein n=1 Tax=Capsicum baccatum TaxID=33114 RepID=A0A2G2XPJ8_CAPBA|nr:hypothetical protein CQW23_01732 [Capsicum baccatum]
MPIMEWKSMIRFLANYKPRFYHQLVKRELIEQKIVKYNTDGDCRGNLGIGSYDFFLGNEEGDLIYAQGDNIGFTTNVVAETKAILEEIKYYVSKDIRTIRVETDSLLMVNILNEDWKVP